MIRLGIIGAGTIFQQQIAALSVLNDRIRITVVCDSDEKQLTQAKKFFENFENIEELGGVRFCRSEMELTSSDCDAVLIATPPKTHYQLAKACLGKGLSVLLEKPAVLSMEELLSLYEYANRANAVLHVAYHAAFAVDLLWWIKNRTLITKRYGLGSLSKILCGFYDPYVTNGVVLAGKEKLLGSYIDSGVNQLSVCDRIVDASESSLNNFECTDHRYNSASDNLVITSETEYSNSDISIHLDTGWIYGLNRKRTVLLFKDCEKQIVLDHSNQRVLIQTAKTETDIISDLRSPMDIELKPTDEVLYENTTEVRLKRHYMGVFLDFYDAYADRNANDAASIRIHRLLLENHK